MGRLADVRARLRMPREPEEAPSSCPRCDAERSAAAHAWKDADWLLARLDEALSHMSHVVGLDHRAEGCRSCEEASRWLFVLRADDRPGTPPWEEQVAAGKRLVEAYLRERGKEVGPWTGRRGYIHALKVSGRTWEFLEQWRGASGGDGRLVHNIQTSLDELLTTI